MLKKYSLILLSLAAASTIFCAGTVVAKNEGLPKGKPFQAIQTSINNLVGQADTIEVRLASLETAVAGLLAGDEELLALISANEASIVELVAEMQSEISRLEGFIEAKQNIVNGICSPGSSIRVINPDGSVVCEIDDATSSISHVVVQKSQDLSPALISGWKERVTIECPIGYTLTGGGFWSSADTVYIGESYPTGNQWSVYGINNTPFVGQSIIVYANCIKFN